MGVYDHECLLSCRLSCLRSTQKPFLQLVQDNRPRNKIGTLLEGYIRLFNQGYLALKSAWKKADTSERGLEMRNYVDKLVMAGQKDKLGASWKKGFQCSLAGPSIATCIDLLWVTEK